MQSPDLLRIFSILVILLGLLCLCSSEDDIKGYSIFQLEHSLGSDDKEVFSNRGTVTIQSLKSGEAMYSDLSFPDDELLRLKELVKEDGEYRVRLAPKNLPDNSQQVIYASSFVKACLLYESRLQAMLNINVDASGNVLGISLKPSVAYCTGITVRDKDLSDFKIKVEVIQTVTGSQPETMDYIKRFEEEKAQKAKGATEDNRSFFAKYWMYLVPVVIILMFASGEQPGAQGGSGG